MLDGRGSQLYDPAVQAEVQRTILGGQTFQAGLNPFNNPPHMVLPYLPLGLLPLDAAFLLWTAIQVGPAGRDRGAARARRRDEIGRGSSGSASSPPSSRSPRSRSRSSRAPSRSCSSAGCRGLWSHWTRGRDARAGGLLALASVKPQGMFGIGDRRARWRAVAPRFAAAAGWVAGLAVARDGRPRPGDLGSYVRFLGTYTSSFDDSSVDPSVMWNLRGTLALLLGRDNAPSSTGSRTSGSSSGSSSCLLWRRGGRATADRGSREDAIPGLRLRSRSS